MRSAKLLHRSQTANNVAVTFWSLPGSRLLAGLCPTIEAPGSTGASPQTGEQLALAALQRLIGQGVPASALRATGEAS